ncbi:MAG: hypothetical protein DI598_14485 [Pseudopedobacter saltans]|uniref:Uncharacterized protein n=1 Tax=Pseudopedobacter saltans TaxID=151895 RepID=A0A2W5ESD5_9SPHI|nr:MAG: hypothetical protein DI598_14485 [Pseudopedobacter saltans]
MKMVSTLLHHQWLSFWRTRSAGKNFAVQILIGIFLFYLVSMAAFLGIALPSMVKHQYPDGNVTAIICRFVLYYFLIDLFSRFVFQELPTINLEEYLTKNIRKKDIVRFLNFRSMFHFLNFIPLFLFLPFSFITIWKDYGLISMIGFDLSIMFLTISNHFFISYIKRKSIIKTSYFFTFLILFSAIVLLDYKNILSVNKFSEWLFMKIITMPWLFVFAFALSIITYWLNSKFLFNNLYIDELAKKQKRVQNNTEYAWLNKYGAMGDLIGNELKLLTRNKRPKGLLTMSVIFLCYGFLFYKPDMIAKGELGYSLFGAFIVVGMFTVAYSNFLFSWQSAYFDGILTSKIRIREYIKSKIFFLFITATIPFIISTLYGLMSWKVILLQIAAYLFSIGVNNFIMAYLATYNYKFVDMSQKAALNYSGTGVVQWLYALIIMILPAIIYASVAYTLGSWAGIITLSIIGIVSTLFYNVWIDMITKAFIKRKYKIAEGFREK